MRNLTATICLTIAVALSLSGCKTGDTSLDKLVGSVSDAVSGHPPPTLKDLSDTMLRGLLRRGREGSGKGARVIHRMHLNLRSNELEPPLDVLPYGDTHSLYPSQTYSATLPV